MTRTRRVPGYMMPFLRAWRDSLHLSRPEVVTLLSQGGKTSEPIDQATLAKWESGESAVKVEDLELLAEIYGVSVDRLFFSPRDERTPELLRLAHEIITSKDPEAVARWLASGQDMKDAPLPPGKNSDAA